MSDFQTFSCGSNSRNAQPKWKPKVAKVFVLLAITISRKYPLFQSTFSSQIKRSSNKWKNPMFIISVKRSIHSTTKRMTEWQNDRVTDRQKINVELYIIDASFSTVSRVADTVGYTANELWCRIMPCKKLNIVWLLWSLKLVIHNHLQFVKQGSRQNPHFIGYLRLCNQLLDEFWE